MPSDVLRMPAEISEIGTDKNRVPSHRERSNVLEIGRPFWCVEQVELHIGRIERIHRGRVALQTCRSRFERSRTSEITHNWNESVFGLKPFHPEEEIFGRQIPLLSSSFISFQQN